MLQLSSIVFKQAVFDRLPSHLSVTDEPDW
jgi:hypothetical protein